jgi:predicted alpha/beta-hydrolase family hydrolase
MHLERQMHEQYVDTPVGQARLDWFDAIGTEKAVVVLGHGTATGVEAADLQAIAQALPLRGITVVLMTQPYRVEHNFSVSGESSLDIAWTGIWPHVAKSDVPIYAGGRSAGSQVACRTAHKLGASGVVALAYPIFGPGSSTEILNTKLPTLVVQGGADPFGTLANFPKLPGNFETVLIPGANHMFGDMSRDTTKNNLNMIVSAVGEWVTRQANVGHPKQ